MACGVYWFTPCAGSCLAFCIGQFAVLSCLIVSMTNTISSISIAAESGCGMVVLLTFQGCLLMLTSLWLLLTGTNAYRPSPTSEAHKIIHHLKLWFSILFTMLWLASLVLSILECPLLCDLCPNAALGNNSGPLKPASTNNPCQCWTFQTLTEEMYNILTKIIPHLGLSICFAIKSIDAFRKRKNIHPSNSGTEGHILEDLTDAETSPAMSILDSLQMT